MSLHRVFVYGTLKKGEPNHHWFSAKEGIANYLGSGSTETKFPLIIATRYNIPFLLFQPGEGNVREAVHSTTEVSYGFA